MCRILHYIVLLFTSISISNTCEDDISRTFTCKPKFEKDFHAFSEEKWQPCSKVSFGLDIICSCKKSVDNGTHINCDGVTFHGDFPLLPYRHEIHSFRQRHSGLQSLPSQIFTASRLPLKYVDFSYNKIRRFPERLFEGIEKSLEVFRASNNLLGDQLNPFFSSSELNRLRALKILDLSSNQIKNIDENAFRNLEKLEELDLKQNCISEISSRVMRTLVNVKHLNLQGNDFTSVREDSFAAPLAVETLDLSDNYIVSIENRSFRNLTLIRQLNLSSNKLFELKDDAFYGLDQLEDLDISNNLFHSFPSAALRRLSNLKSLNISGNLFDDIEGFTKLTINSLEILDLSRNSIRRIHNGSFMSAPKLRILNLGANSIRKVEGGCFSGLESLESLTLDDNSIFSVPTAALENLPRLKILSLSQNRIGVISSSTFEGLSKLYELNLSYNLIREIPKGTFENMNLLILNLRGNLLKFLSDEALKPLSSSLVFVDLSHNKLAVFPKLKLQSIDSLYMEKNEISEIAEDTFENMESLKLLNISGNLIETIDKNSFISLRMIEILDLSDNLLQYFDYRLFVPLSSLSQLYLQKNSLTSIQSKTFSNLTKLHSIDLSQNQIYEIQTQAFSNLPLLESLILENNKIHILLPSIFSTHGGINQIKRLLLKRNQLIEVKKDLLDSFPNMQEMDISENHIEKMPYDFSRSLPFLSHIDLSRNRIKSIDSLQFSGMFRLRCIDLSFNQIKDISADAFQNSTQLHFINLGHNMIEDLKVETFQGIAKLNLNLESNKLSTLSHLIFERNKVQKLQSLNLASNQFEKIPTDALQKQYFFLEAINLSKNKIKEVPINIDILVNLKMMDFSFNPLNPDSIDNILNEPKTVRYLNLAGVGVSKIPQIIEAPFLRCLNLSFNSVEKIASKAFQKTANLESLDISYNNITNINSGLSSSWPKLSFLKNLFLSNNPISSIMKGDFRNLKSIKFLRLSELPVLQRLEPSVFENFPLLEQLWIYKFPQLNELDLRGILSKLKVLKRLKTDITESKLEAQVLAAFNPRLEEVELHGRGTLKEISPGALAGFTSKTINLSLQNTSIESLPSALLFSVPMSTNIILGLSGAKLKTLSPQLLSVIESRGSNIEIKGLANNPLKCDCNARALRRWVLNKVKRDLIREKIGFVDGTNMETDQDRSRKNNKLLRVRSAPRKYPSPKIVSLNSLENEKSINITQLLDSNNVAEHKPSDFNMIMTPVTHTSRQQRQQWASGAHSDKCDAIKVDNDLKNWHCSAPLNYHGRRLMDMQEKDLFCEGEGEGEVMSSTTADLDNMEDPGESKNISKLRPIVFSLEEEEPLFRWTDSDDWNLKNSEDDEARSVAPVNNEEKAKASNIDGNGQEMNTVDTLIIGIVGGVVAFVAILIVLICICRFKAGKAYRAGPLAGSLAHRYKQKCTCISHNQSGWCSQYITPAPSIHNVPVQHAQLYRSQAHSRATIRSSNSQGPGSNLSVCAPSTLSRASYFSASMYYLTYPTIEDETCQI
ncbi:chaoptin-like [Artemia franciscana]|uniref:Chaoptin n=1 Tax=Artemia franciscana TaxID=6661 RepID=A0AA88IU73_ARTSF|nr:hypothetical protein QYM36_007611 [Artemia franciscana]KAK2726826.1 hypothetical protein QYM36_007611 [Artemia franciscana]KAK2726827.1 hypothetical protein QYM36_007611 [Artemia franciscana]